MHEMSISIRCDKNLNLEIGASEGTAPEPSRGILWLMDEIVVAKASPGMVAVASFGVLVAMIGFPVGEPAGAIVTTILCATAIWRITRMKVSVLPAAVEVVNFFSTHRLDLDSVRIIDEKGLPVLMSDAGGPMDLDGRTLYLSDKLETKVVVGVAPRHGNRLDTIAEDLYRAIAKMQAQGS